LSRRFLLLLVVLSLTASACFLTDGNDNGREGSGATPAADRFVPKRAYLQDACKLPPEWVRLIHRGWVPGPSRGHDLILVPKPPNYLGGPVNASHSGPYDFLQEVPLLFYGPGFVQQLGRTSVGREVTLADVAPTLADLLNFDWPNRIGTSLTEILNDNPAPPRLIFEVVLDGGGWNDLRYWPDRWPHIARLMGEGTTIEDAIVGSSPSITPSVHTTLSTGAYPRLHEVTGITVRQDDGSLAGAFSTEARLTNADSTRPDSSLAIPTLADLWDAANNNAPLIGMFATGNYPLGMLGYGAAYEGGDKDILALTQGEEWATNGKYYSMPDYVNSEVRGPQQDIAAVDRADGAADGLWQGHEIRPIDATPALASWQNRAMQAVLDREGFGDDDVPDLFFVNYKSPDYAGHEWNMVAPEQGDVLESVDKAVGDMIHWLDTNIGNDQYVFVLTADHGQTPINQGGWPIGRGEILSDINERFDKLDNDVNIVQSTSAVSLFMNRAELAANDVRPEDVASYLSRYTISDNTPSGTQVAEEFKDRGAERIFSAVFPGRRLPDIADCTNALE
jgi:predicted AlkP superfamily pyrophosphatase or phosphodiesterase